MIYYFEFTKKVTENGAVVYRFRNYSEYVSMPRYKHFWDSHVPREENGLHDLCLCGHGKSWLKIKRLAKLNALLY